MYEITNKNVDGYTGEAWKFTLDDCDYVASYIESPKVETAIFRVTEENDLDVLMTLMDPSVPAIFPNMRHQEAIDKFVSER